MYTTVEVVAAYLEDGQFTITTERIEDRVSETVRELEVLGYTILNDNACGGTNDNDNIYVWQRIEYVRTPTLLVGRHQGAEIPGLDIQAQENVTFSLNRDEAAQQIAGLIEKATSAGLALVFQNTPAIVASALIRMTCSMSDEWIPISNRASKIGLIISRPGPRLAGVGQVFRFDEVHALNEAERAVQHANGRAQVAVRGHELTVTVDPVSPWEFDHVEWL